MRDLDQWLVWRREKRRGEWTKVPYSPLTGVGASSTAPETWAGYQEAVKACKEHSYDGIGFVFTSEDDFCGVDLDKCLDPETGEIEPWAQQIVELLNSHTEISPSGTGVHVLVRAKLPEGRNRKGRFEAYDRGRYFTVTGKHLPGSPQSIEGRQEELENVVRRVFGSEIPESTNGHTRPVAAPRRVEAGLVVVDPLMAFLSGETNSHKDQDVRKALAPLAGLAERTGAAVLVVRHLNEAAANNPLYRGGGSLGIIGAARMAFVVGKDPQDENRRVLASTKNNLAIPPASLMFGLEEADSGSVRINWLGSSEVSAKDLLATPQDQEHADARSEAVEFLNDVLADGPVAASQIKKEAEDAGISERTLARAKKVVGMMSYREGETGERGRGQWLWKLPVVDLVDDEIKDAKGCQNIDGGIFNHTEGIEEPNPRIDKPDSLRMPTTGNEPIKDARVPTIGDVGTLNYDETEMIKDANSGILKECIHGLEPDSCNVCNGNVKRLVEEGAV